MMFILLCLAVIALAAPVPAPYGNWIAGGLAIAALVLALLTYVH